MSSVRGPSGGYRLSENAESLRISEILFAVDEGMDAMSRGAGATGATPETQANLLTDKLWEQLSANVYVFLHQTRLSDILFQQMMPCPAVPAFIELVDE